MGEAIDFGEQVGDILIRDGKVPGAEFRAGRPGGQGRRGIRSDDVKQNTHLTFPNPGPHSPHSISHSCADVELFLLMIMRVLDIY